MATVEPETIDGTADEIPVGEHVERSSSALALRPPAGTQVLMPMDVEQVVQGMAAYQALLPRLLTPGDWQGPPGKKGSFVKKSGWRKIARAFNLSLERVSETVERDDQGVVVRASMIYRAVAPNGQYGDGDGYCSIDESRFAEAKGRQKLENDLRATATTRAKNRAISDLVGMGEVSAEEMVAGGGADGPLYGPVVADDLKAATVVALVRLLATDDDPLTPAPRDLVEAAAAAAKVIAATAGYMPKIVADTLLYAAEQRTMRRAAATAHTVPEAEPVDADVVPVAEPDASEPVTRSYPTGNAAPVTPPSVVRMLGKLADRRTISEVKGAFAFAHVQYPKDAQDNDRFEGLTVEECERLMKQLDPEGAAKSLPAGSVPMNDPRAPELCVCKDGLTTPPEDADGACPLAGHGVPF